MEQSHNKNLRHDPRASHEINEDHSCELFSIRVISWIDLFTREEPAQKQEIVTLLHEVLNALLIVHGFLLGVFAVLLRQVGSGEIRERVVPKVMVEPGEIV
jgi:hypothetical protein